MKRLVENPESDNYDVINRLKFFCLMLVITGHRLFIELATPAFNVEFIDSVRSNNEHFCFVK